MTEENEQEQEQDVPEVGPGSPAGIRYFVSSRFPNLSVCVRPAQMKTDTERAKTGVYANFQSMAKPEALQGDGHRGTKNHSGTDQNDSRKWGIFGPIMDPGPEPEEGYKDDGAEVKDPRARLKKAKKALNREVIDRLRATDHYRLTLQNNEVYLDTKLAEVTWDPAPFSGSIEGEVKRGRPSIGKDGATFKQEKGQTLPPPPEARPAAPSARVPKIGGRSKVAA